MSDARLCIFGEVLFDHFPDGKRVLGGAPFNVAWHLQAFGESPRFISRVGKDAEGDEILTAMRGWGMDLAGVQTDPARPTGKVSVSFEDGEPAYEIIEDCAYDAINSASVAASMTDTLCKLLYHGSLALRNKASREALLRLADGKPQNLFVDVNLRSPWWQREPILEMLRLADWVKLNDDELNLLGLQANGAVLGPAEFLREFDLRGLVLTRGSAGAELYTARGDSMRVSPDDNVDIVDTVGAGDAFASVIILGLAREWPLQVTLQRAQEFASKVVGLRGATVSDPGFYQPLVENWRLAQPSS
ncbi:MAG: carbohydrate kinase [Gammaproteobacteria bacterium]|nr:carbohydrate kinase [Gammaproteobacteria bacterium]MDH3449893.1 carbohydrate kinase [Gammaproteobacteria bacterium]